MSCRGWLANRLDQFKSKDLAIRALSVVSVFLFVDGFFSTAFGEKVTTGKTPSSIEEGVRAFNQGDYLKVDAFLRKALMDMPDSHTHRHHRLMSISRLAWEEFEKEDFERSKSLFHKALSIEESPSYYKGLASSQIKLKEYASAEKTLKLVPFDRDVKGMLKYIYSERGKSAHEDGFASSVVENFQKLLILDPSDSEAKTRLRMARGAEDERGFGKKDGSHFIVIFEGQENIETAYIIGVLLEEAYYKIGAELGFYPEDKITTVLYSEERFRDVTRTPSWTGAIYDGRIKIPSGGITEKTSVLEKVIFHEYTHAIIHRLSGGNAPMWFNEGLSQHFEERKERDYNKTIWDAVKTGGVVLKDLEGSFMGFSDEQARIAYALSLSATEYLIQNYGLFSARNILESLKRGETVGKAILSTLSISYEEFDEDWQNYLKKRNEF